jgi:hypothetical protein
MSSLLKDTFFSVDFLTSLIDEVDIISLAKPIINAQMAQWIPSGMEFLNAYIAPVVDEILVNQEPWIKEQLKAVAGPVADYLLGEIDHFSIKISTGPLLDNLREILHRDIAKLPIPQLSGPPSSLMEAGFNRYFDEFAKSIPSSLEIDESLIGSGLPAEIKSALTKAERELGIVRDYIGTFKLVYILLIVLMLLLVLGILLILREAKGITRSLGIVFLLYGIIQFVLFLVLGNYLSTQISGLSGIPMHLQAWLEGFVRNALALWQVMGIGFMAGGFILVAVSFLLKSQEEERHGKHPDL